jgi:putative acetyltransferase
MQLRRHRFEDAPALAEVFRRSVGELGPRHYTPAQVAAWLADAPDTGDMQLRAVDGRHILVATDDAGRPVAFADLEADGHIDLLYVLPEAAGTGIANALVKALETIARTDGLTRLTVEASEAAKGLFLRQGYTLLERNDFTKGGVAMHNYRMEKLLQRQSSSHARRPAPG